MKDDLVIVILINYNQNDYTLRCVESLLKSNYDNFKILLVDNGSLIDNYVELKNNLPDVNSLIVKRLDVNIGYSRGTNYALEQAIKLDPKFFLIMNNDTTIDENAIRELVKTSKDFNKKAIVTGKVYHYDQPNVLQFVGYSTVKKSMLQYKHMGMDEIDKGQYDKVQERDMIDDIFVLHPVELYNKIGGYTPYLFINGVNIDMGLRAIDEGYKLIFTPEAKLYHKGSVSIGGRGFNPKLAYWNIESSLILRYLHLSKWNFIRYYLVTVVSVFRTYIKAFFHKVLKKQSLKDYARAKFLGLLAFNKWLKNKEIASGYNPF